MLTPADIAQAVTATRMAFGDLFLQAQVGAQERVRFDAITQAADDRQAFTQALLHAQVNGFLDELTDLIIDAGLENGSLTNSIRASNGDAELQAMTDASGVMQPDVVAKGINLGMKWTGKIIIDKSSKGTGILIANNRILTAWHVVQTLFDPVPGGGYAPKPNGADILEVEFDDFLQRIGRGQGLQGRGTRRVKAHQQWCVAFSPCHEDELASHLPADLTQLAGRWDYAIIRLSEPIGLERSWATPNTNVAVPKAKDKVFVIQHPGGQTMKVDINNVAAASDQQRAAIPRLRFLHYVNTAPGSSGGPCFDRSLYLFGIHQGQWDGVNPVTNRGIPIVRVLEDVAAQLGDKVATEPEESLIWRLDQAQGYSPVIGCDDFQQAVARSAFAGKPRIFTITGARGSGKSFRVKTLMAMLPDASHLKIKLEGEKIAKLDPLALVQVICSEARVPAPIIEPAAEMNSTADVWLKDEVVRKVIEALNTARNGRLVWIMITDLNVFDVGDEVSPMLFLLYEELLKKEWLRIVLDGMKGDIPASLQDLHFWHRVSALTQEQIEVYLRRFSTFMSFDVDGMAKVDAKRAYRKYIKEQDNEATQAAAAKNVAADVEQMARDYLESADEN